MPSDIPYAYVRLCALAVTFVLSAFFSGSETALFSFQPHELKHMAQGTRTERTVALLRERPKRLLITVLLGNMVVNVVFYSVSFLLILDLEPRIGSTWSFALGLASLMLVILGGEVVPKNTAVIVYRPWGKLAALPLFAMQTALLVIVLPLEKLMDWLAQRVGHAGRRELGPEELEQLVQLGAREGTFDFGASRMITEVIGLNEVALGELMVPRTEMVCFDVEDSRQELMDLFREHKLTMIPVYEGEMDNMLGVVHVKDVFYRPEQTSLDELARSIPFLPEMATVEEALALCRHEHSKTVFVVDEYGAVVGLVTIEDLLEEIVGDIADEYDEEVREPVEVLHDGTLRVEGRLSLRVWQEIFDLELPETKVNTVGGWAMTLLGKLPEPGDRIRYEGMELVVESVSGRRVSSLLVHALPEVAPESNGEAGGA